MKVGDLVRIRQDIEEYVSVRGDTVGVIVSSPAYDGTTGSSGAMIKLFRVLWSSDLELERLYEDELELISESR